MEFPHEVMSKKTAENILALMKDTMNNGYITFPRGMEIREKLDAQLTVNPKYPFQTFGARKYNIDYFKKEMRWKLGASKMDDSIKEHAKMWESVQNPDGSFNSNYGQYWFGQQMGLMKVVFELIRDRHSRRAVIPMLRDDHMSPETKDTVCTESISFVIRDGYLHCSVHMRSSDQIFGLGTDIPTFSVLHMLVHALIQDTYSDVLLGNLTITAASSHIYKRHFQMVEQILEDGMSTYVPFCLPSPTTAAEAMAIIAHRGIARPVQANWHLYKFIYSE